ncbi:MAG: DUF3343 domain-containing protein [Bacillota bacterium]
MVENKEKIILFQSTHHSIKAKNILSNNGLKFRMTAVPPVISADCGSAINTELELEDLKALFDKNNILVEAIYEITTSNRNKEYKKIYSRE